ncbi:MAG: branched-chain amino acid ABC transporter permease [Thermoproteota archaeon]|jgi:Branched-chain amino acid ABC-type transport system, permease components
MDPLTAAVIVVSGITILSSLGLTLTYLTTKVPNFAHSSFIAVGAYMGVYAQQVAKVNPLLYLPYAFLAGAAIGFLQYKILLKPLIDKGANIVTLMIATLVVTIFFFGVINIVADWMATTYKVNSVLINFKNSDFTIYDIPISVISVLIFVVLVSISLYYLLNKTKFGIAMRAAIENPSLASVVGINIDRVYTFSWILSGGLAGIAGVFFGFQYTISTNSADFFLPYVFASSILGGLGNIYGPIPGGIIIGTSSIVIPYAIAQLGYPIALNFALFVPLAIMAATLLIIPQGITGINFRKLFVRKLKVQ